MDDGEKLVPQLDDSCVPHPSWMNWGWKKVRRAIVFVTGMTVLLVGLAMVLLPGPATVVIPLGLAILATEFTWAAWALHHAKQEFLKMAHYANETLGLPYGQRIRDAAAASSRSEPHSRDDCQKSPE